MTGAPGSGAAGGARGPGSEHGSGEADGSREPDPSGETTGSGEPRAAGEPGASGEPGGPGGRASGEPRQRVERTGRRRARLTPAPDTDTTPEKPRHDAPAPGGTPDDDRITRERPPHW